MECIFCKIINKDIPNYTVYEDDNVLAFLDIFPHAKGHTVVIPKKHASTLLDLDDNLLGGYMAGIKRAQERIQTVLRPDGFTVGWNHGEAGGQVVPHLHTHIFPRWNGDGGGNMHSVVKNVGNLEVKEIAKLFI